MAMRYSVRRYTTARYAWEACIMSNRPNSNLLPTDSDAAACTDESDRSCRAIVAIPGLVAI